MQCRLAGWSIFHLLILCSGCQSSTTGVLHNLIGGPAEGQTIEVRHGAVVSVSVDASRVGRDVMMRGGNAVDAAVATAFALAVTWPEAGNIGGGGFMVIYPGKESPPVVVDYRETAPAAAKADTFADGKVSQQRLVGVPGTVRGLAAAHERFGKLPW